VEIHICNFIFKTGAKQQNNETTAQ